MVQTDQESGHDITFKFNQQNGTVFSVPISAITDELPTLREIQPDKVELLEHSFLSIGQTVPIIIMPRVDKKNQYTLICGQHRLRAAKNIGWDEIFVILFTGSRPQAELWQIDENLVRADLTVLEVAEHIKYRDEKLKELGLKETVGAPSNGSNRLTAPKIASLLNLSLPAMKRRMRIAEKIPKTVRDKLRSTEAADSVSDLMAISYLKEEEQELASDLYSCGETPTVRDAIQEAKRRNSILAVQSLPTKTYNVVYADLTDPSIRKDIIGASDYIKRICLDIAEDAIAFLWVTPHQIETGIAILKMMDFYYETNYVWLNMTGESKSPFYNSENHTHLLVGMKGAFKPAIRLLSVAESMTERQDYFVPSVIDTSAGLYESKHDKAKEIMERLYPTCNYVRITFGKKVKKWKGWDKV